MELSFFQKARISLYVASNALMNSDVKAYMPDKPDKFYENPHDIYDFCKKEKPIFFKAKQCGWVVTGEHDFVRDLLKDPRLTVRASAWMFYEDKDSESQSDLKKFHSRLLMMLPKDDHMRVRKPG